MTILHTFVLDDTEDTVNRNFIYNLQIISLLL